MSISHDILNAKILVVDDNAANIKLLALILARAGYKDVSSVTDPCAVFDLYKHHRYDAILLDLNMPGMDGFQVMEALKTIEPEEQLPVIVITAQPDLKQRAFQAGAKDFISKPFDYTEVLARIRNLLMVRLLYKRQLDYQADLERRSAELSSINGFLDSVIENIPHMVFIKDAVDLRLTRLNRAGESILGCAREDILGKTDYDLFSEEQAAFFERKDREVLENKSVVDIYEEPISTREQGVRILHTKKVPMFNERGEVSYLLGISEDATDRIAMEKEIHRLNAALAEHTKKLQATNDQQEAAMSYAAKFDTLTGVPNLPYFLKLTRGILQSHVQSNRRLALVVLDIRNFGRINDSFGTMAGDEILTLVARRLSTSTQFGCARVGGNKFAMVVSDLQGDGDVAPALHKYIFDSIAQPFVINGQDITIAVHCGIALFPGDAEDVDELLGNAEAALKTAKRIGEEYLFYTSDLNARVAELISIESELRRAIVEEQFVLHYQPKVDTGNGRLTGFEALLRWNSPKRGMVSPGEFIPILEETGMILDVGRWVLRQTAADYLEWKNAGLNPPPIAVNISAIQLRKPGFAENLLDLHCYSGEAPAAIDLEITETVLMNDIDRLIPLLQRLKDAGFGIAIDDFGTGYSSFSYLTKLPVTDIKIDRSFIQNLSTDPRHNKIVSTIILLAHALQLKVVAEGVESLEQSVELSAMGCDQMQGYFHGRPIPKDEARVFMQKNPAAS